MNVFNKLMITMSTILVLWSCSDNEEPINGSSTSISLSTNIIQMDKNGGNATVIVTSSNDWRLSGQCNWAHPSVTSGKNGDEVIFTIDPNTIDEKRIATFKFFTGSSVIPLQIESSPVYTMELLSDENISLSKEENTIQIELNTNIANPTIIYNNGSEEWLTLNRCIDFDGKKRLLFTVSENSTYKDRSTTITFSSPLVAVPVNVNLTQKQTDAIIPENTKLTYDLAARNISFKVRYNVDYKIAVTQGNDWITDQSISDPQTDDDGLSTVTVTYKLTETSVTRGGTVSITNTDNTLVSNVSVIQKDPNIELAEIPDNNFRSFCISNGWVLSIAGTQCLVLEAGLNATSLSYISSSNQINDFTGIENFPNLTTIQLGYCTSMRVLDISKIHKVSSLSFNSMRGCEEYNLGDNPITSFDAGGSYAYSNAKSLKIISSKLENIDLTLSSWYTNLDYITSIDVSECPALTTLIANRTSKIQTIYLNTGQIIPNLTKNDETKVVYK